MPLVVSRSTGHLVGFAYGYTGSTVSGGRTRPARRLSELTADLPHERWTLMTTADSEDPARRLYASHGWFVIGDGLQPEQVVMAHGTPRTPGPVQV